MMALFFKHSSISLNLTTAYKGQGIVEYAGVFIVATVLIAGLLNTSYPQISVMFSNVLAGFSAMLFGPLA